MWARAWVGMALGAVLVAGCAGEPGGGTAEPWPEGSSTDLVPTGLALVGGTGEGDVAVDGAGMVWVDGPWQVARVDPATGVATIWDAADDLAFTSVRGLAPAQPAGVWLDSGDRVRLFDGERFLVDIAVPAQYADVEGDQVASGEFLQVGDELWVSGGGGVARWADGSWSSVGLGTLSTAGPLAVDSDGAVWAGGVSTVDGEERNVVVRFDGTQWTTPGNADQAPAGGIGDIAADPSGGVWVASTQDGPATDQHGIYRFDGTTWSKAGPGGYAGDMAVTTGGQLWALAGAGNGIDPSGEVRVARLAADGTWEAFGSDEGAARGQRGAMAVLAVAGDRSSSATSPGSLRSEGDQFVTLWQDPTAVVQPGVRGRLRAGPRRRAGGERRRGLAPDGTRGVMRPAWLVAGTTLSRSGTAGWASVGPVSRRRHGQAPGPGLRWRDLAGDAHGARADRR